MTNVYVRFNGWIETMPVIAERKTGYGTSQIARNDRGLTAICHPNGLADIVMRDHNGKKTYDGFGTWSTRKTELPKGKSIKVRSGQRIWSVDDQRWRTVAETFVAIVEKEDEDDLTYLFRRDGRLWSIGMEDV